MFKEDGTEVRKFPNGGYDVRVVRKQEVLDCIDNNIIDKDIALDLINQIEIDACQYVNEGKWASIPYIGNIRLNEGGNALRENKELLADAKAKLSEEKYILFRKQLVVTRKIKAKEARYFNYMVSIYANLNRKLYNALVESNGETFAKVLMFSFSNMEVVGDNNNTRFDCYGERQANYR